MKMSDVFELPFDPIQIDIYGANSNEAISFDEIESAAAFAINNHDKLVEFVESVLGVDYRHGGSLGNDGQFYYKVPESIFDKAERILKELGHEV